MQKFQLYRILAVPKQNLLSLILIFAMAKSQILWGKLFAVLFRILYFKSGETIYATSLAKWNEKQGASSYHIHRFPVSSFCLLSSFCFFTRMFDLAIIHCQFPSLAPSLFLSLLSVCVQAFTNTLLHSIQCYKKPSCWLS